MADTIEQLDTISDTDSEEMSVQELRLVRYLHKGEAARIIITHVYSRLVVSPLSIILQ